MGIRQPRLTWRMRSLLVEWMVKLQGALACPYEAMFGAVKIVDVFLSWTNEEFPKNELQLLGMTALAIASESKQVC